MKSLPFFAFYLLVLTNTKFCSGDSEELHETPIVNSKQGLIKGITERSLSRREFYSYMSIPFAKPPIGKLRFKPPASNEPWLGTLDATRLPDSCLQNDFFGIIKDNENLQPIGKEDCLYLNVYTTKPNELQAKLPVMVFLHGGGFICGASQEYLPHVLLNEDIVFVVIQYRLGIFGFLSTEDSVLPGNMGLKDQQLALKWIKKNIQEFGGDPDRITIFGESAGGASVHYQVLSPGSKGLFQRAILQSGTALNPWSRNLNHREFALEVGNTVSCSLTRGTQPFLDCLQEVEAEKLMKIASSTVEWGFGPLYVLPRVDGVFLPDLPENLLKEGRYNKVDIMSGVTRDEGALILLSIHINPKLLEKLQTNFESYGNLSLYIDEENSEEIATQIYQHYLQGKNFDSLPEIREQLQKLYTDRFFGVGHDIVANIHARDEDVNLYLYEFDHFGERSLLDYAPDFDKNNLVAHFDDLYYLFSGGPYFPLPLTRDSDLRVREIMILLWTNFAKTGNPTPSGTSFTWDKATGDSFRRLSIATNPKMMDDNYKKVRKYWSSLKLKENLRMKKTEDVKIEL